MAKLTLLESNQPEKLQEKINDLSDSVDGISKVSLGLGNVNNTSDLNKPVSNPQKVYIDNGDALTKAAANEQAETLVAEETARAKAAEQTLTETTSTLSNELDSVRQDIARAEHFRGYVSTTADLNELDTPSFGDFAYNAQTGTKWIYDTAWTDTGVAVPDQTVPPSDSTPLINGVPDAGTSTQYARGDHRHPTDTSRVPTSRKINNKTLGDDITLTADDVGAATKAELNAKQNTLVSGTNIKTINGQSVLGGGNIVVQGGSGSGGTGVTVGGEVQDTWDADSKVDVIRRPKKLSDVMVGDNLAGKTLIFDTSNEYVHWEGSGGYFEFENERILVWESVAGALGCPLFGVFSHETIWEGADITPEDACFYSQEDMTGWGASIDYPQGWQMSSYTFPTDGNWVVRGKVYESEWQSPENDMFLSTAIKDETFNLPYVPEIRKIGNVDLSTDRTLAQIGAPPISHASPTGVYGAANVSTYGHTRVAGNYINSEILSSYTGTFAESHYRQSSSYAVTIDAANFYGTGRITVYSSTTNGFINLVNFPSDFPTVPTAIYFDNWQGRDGNYRRQEVRANNSTDIWVRTLNGLPPILNSNWSAWTKIGSGGGGSGGLYRHDVYIVARNALSTVYADGYDTIHIYISFFSQRGTPYIEAGANLTSTESKNGLASLIEDSCIYDPQHEARRLPFFPFSVVTPLEKTTVFTDCIYIDENHRLLGIANSDFAFMFMTDLNYMNSFTDTVTKII